MEGVVGVLKVVVGVLSGRTSIKSGSRNTEAVVGILKVAVAFKMIMKY